MEQSRRKEALEKTTEHLGELNIKITYLVCMCEVRRHIETKFDNIFSWESLIWSQLTGCTGGTDLSNQAFK